ncbi:hypothetical protein TNIN_484721 [Trichonephila inaurata madagascariensis]|uniref:Uncharacterized protein n=1 Tax=Trichonephila inaurata madagascariensis TaxID=2747483 RepID=A0A8X7CCD4_9ARAC|nr:hypothetical protein TNIN_484721 [Trichonephila inaurata madagascariensis]
MLPAGTLWKVNGRLTHGEPEIYGTIGWGIFALLASYLNHGSHRFIPTGMSVGNLLGGNWVHNLGARTTFYWAGIMSLIFGTASCILNGLLACKVIK